MTTELKVSVRQLIQMPGFTITAVLTLALGIGATTAIFTLVHQILLKSLPVKDPGQLWRIGDAENCCINGGLPTIGKKVGDWTLFSYEQYREFRDNTTEFSSLAAFQAGENQVAARRAGSGEPARSFYVEFVSGNAFDALGVMPLLGRAFRAADDVRGAPAVAVLSYPAWEQKFGHDRGIVGSVVFIDGAPFTIVGVAPPNFYGEQLRNRTPAFWLPINTLPLLGDRDSLLDHPELQWLNLIGRVAPGVDIGALQGRLQVELQQFLRSPLAKVRAQDAVLLPRQYVRLTPGGAGVHQMQEAYEAGLKLLMWISGFVLLIACANLANLMLVKSIGQVKQVAIQSALGAGRRRLVGQALLQSILVALLGGLAALPVAWAGATLILSLAFRDEPFGISAEPSLTVLGFAFAVSLVTGVLFGIAPGWLVAHVNSIEVLRGAGRSTGRHTTWAQKPLVVTQAAVSVVLVCAAGLLILSLRAMMNQQLGIETAHRYIFNVDPQTAGFKPQQLDQLYRRLDMSLREIPGIKQVAYGLYTPLEGDNWGETVSIEGEPPAAPGKGRSASWARVSEDYFTAIGTKLRSGRLFTQADDASGRNVAVVNETFVKKMLHGRNPLGVHFSDWDGTNNIYEIVGLVEDAQYWGPKEPIRPMYFLPAKQWSHLPAGAPRAADYDRFITSSHYMTSVVIETVGNGAGVEQQVRRAVTAIHPDLTVNRFDSFSHQVKLAFSQQNMIVDLTSLFGAVALLLAGIGLYGVTAYGVAQRTVEIGVRMALGANRRRVQQLVLRGAFIEIGVGLLIGIPAAIANARFLSSQMFGVHAYDPMVLGSAIVVLAGVAFVAASEPARRASSIEPMRALREQ
ncbi:MAG: ABC transporter permease [Acidobacteriia bacterium]|nr:ABC transporter permease [Terriglobia bacterium]